HVVLAGRSTPPMRTARWRANGELLEVGEADLAFDDDEASTLVDTLGRPGTPIRDLPRHPAFATLRLSAGPDTDARRLWEEVLGGISAERRAALARMAVLDQVDDSLAAAMGAEPWSVDELFAGIPMVSRSDQG